MKNLISFMISIYLLGVIGFTPVYLFANSAEETVEELSLSDLLESIGKATISTPHEQRIFESHVAELEDAFDNLDIDMDDGLLDVLESNNDITNIVISEEYKGKKKLYRDDHFERSIYEVYLSFDYKEKSFKSSLIISDKSFFKFQLAKIITFGEVYAKTEGSDSYYQSGMLQRAFFPDQLYNHTDSDFDPLALKNIRF